MVNVDDEPTGLSAYVQNWEFLADSSEGKPADSRPLNPQSFTFINPMGQTYGYTKEAFDSAYLTFGVVALVGVILGSLLWALISGSFRIEWFASAKDFLSHFIGAILMGFGGVLAMGCTVGQAITGISTLALGSFLRWDGEIVDVKIEPMENFVEWMLESEEAYSFLLVNN